MIDLSNISFTFLFPIVEMLLIVLVIVLFVKIRKIRKDHETEINNLTNSLTFQIKALEDQLDATHRTSVARAENIERNVQLSFNETNEAIEKLNKNHHSLNDELAELDKVVVKKV